MTTLTLMTLVVIVYGMLSRHGYGRSLALGGATAAGAAAVVGGTAVPTFYAVAIGAVVALGVGLLQGGGSVLPGTAELPPGAPLLFLFLAWSGLVTVVAPMLFDGLTVLAPGSAVGELRAGTLTSSNFAQLVYLALGVCVVVFLARSQSAGPEIIGLAVGLTTILSLWRYFHEIAGVPYPEGIFDNSPSFTFIETGVNNEDRFRGILSEPAGLAVSSLVTTAYMLSRSTQLTGRRRAGALFVAAAALYLGAISTSATFVVAGGLIGMIAVMTLAIGFALRRTSMTAVVSVVGCMVVIIALWVLPVVVEFVQSSVNQKVSSTSFGDRSTANAVSYGIFLDTWGLGTGVGANRASSFFPSLLSTTGFVGTLLFAAAVIGLVVRSAPVHRYRPVTWALVALIVVKVISGPDLSDSSGVLWMSLGLLSHAVLWANEPEGRVVGLDRHTDRPDGE